MSKSTAMCKSIVFGALILLSVSLALNYTNINYTNYTGGPWHLTVGSLFNTSGLNVSMNYTSSIGPYLHIKTSDAFDGTWKLWKVIPHPPADDFYIEFKIWEYAPGIDLDNGNEGNAAGEAPDNDGPNIFAFIYYSTKGDTNYSDPGFDPSSISWAPLNGYMCHMHVECNFLGDRDDYFYCESKTTYKGWYFDGSHLGDSSAVNKYDSEPITQEQWHTVVLHIKKGQCLNDNLTLVVMGADPFKNRFYEWKIGDFKIYNENQTFTYSLPLKAVVYDNLNKTLTPPTYCGDGIKEDPNSMGQYEQCDGKDGVPPGYRCTSDCKLVPICGDNKIEKGEVCDGTDTPKGYKCSSDCKSMTPICGDGIVVKGELCDGSNVPKGFKCSSDCKSMTPICGDGIVAGNEQCDDKAPVKKGFECINCHLIRDIGPAGNLIDKVESLSIPDGGNQLFEFVSNESISVAQSDLQAYISAKNYTRKVELCNADVCGSEYSTGNGRLTLSAGSNFVKVFNNGGVYYIGIKASHHGFTLPHVSLLLILALVGVGILLLLLIILGIVIYFLVLKRKKHKIRLR